MTELKRKLTLNHTLAIIVGTVIGSGVFMNLPIVAKVTGSPGLAILSWALGGVIWFPQIFILAELGTAYPEEGFGYLYLKKAGSDFLAFLYVWTVFWTSDAPSISIISLSAASALALFSPLFNEPIIARALAIGIIVSLTAIHYRDVKSGGNVQIVLTLLKLTPLFLLIFAGLVFFKSQNLFWLRHAGTRSGFGPLLVGGVAATVWSYAGFANILYMAGEIKNPRQTLPKALIGSVVLITAMYTLIAFATAVLVPQEKLVTFSGSFANPFRFLPWMATIAAGFLAISAFISMVGATNACIMVQPRIEYAMAKDGLFFRIFGHVHPTFETPDYSILLQSGVAILLTFFGDINNLLGYFTMSYVLQNALIYGTIFILRKRKDYHPSFQSPLVGLMGFFAIGTQLYLAYGTFVAYPAGGIFATLILITTGLPFYIGFKRRKAG